MGNLKQAFYLLHLGVAQKHNPRTNTGLEGTEVARLFSAFLEFSRKHSKFSSHKSMLGPRSDSLCLTNVLYSVGLFFLKLSACPTSGGYTFAQTCYPRLRVILCTDTLSSQPALMLALKMELPNQGKPLLYQMEPQATTAREVGRLTSDLHFLLCFFKSISPVSLPTRQGAPAPSSSQSNSPAPPYFPSSNLASSRYSVEIYRPLCLGKGKLRIFTSPFIPPSRVSPAPPQSCSRPSLVVFLLPTPLQED